MSERDSQLHQETDILQRVRQKCQELDDAKVRVEAEVANIRIELEEETRATEALSAQLQKAEDTLRAEREKSSNAQIEMSLQIEKLEETITSMQSVEQQQQQLLDKVTSAFEEFRLEQELQLNQQQDEAEMKDAQYKLEVTSLSEELIKLQESYAEALHTIKSLPAKESVNALTQEVETLTTSLSDIERANEHLKSQLSDAVGDRDRRIEEITSLSGELNTVQTAMASLKAENDRLNQFELNRRNTILTETTSVHVQIAKPPEPTIITQTVPVEVPTPCPYDHEFWEREAALAKVCLDQSDLERQLLAEKADCFAQVASQKTHKLRLQKQLHMNSATEINELKHINHELTKQLEAVRAELHHTASISEIKNSQLGILAASITSLVNDLRTAVTPLSPVVVIPPDPSDLNTSIKELFDHFRILTGRA